MSDDTPEVLYPSPSSPDLGPSELNPDAPDVPQKTLRTIAQWTANLTRAQQQTKSPPGTPVDNLNVNAYKIDSPDRNQTIHTSPVGTTSSGKYAPDIQFGGANVPGLVKGLRRIGDTMSRGGHEYIQKSQVGEPIETGSSIREASLDPNVELYVDHGARGPGGARGILDVNRWTIGHVRSEDDPFYVMSGIPGNSSVELKSVSKKQAQNVGVVITSRASAEMNSSDSDYDTGKGGSQAAAILPGWTQMGLKRLDAGTFDVLTALNDSVTSGPSEETITPGGSFGQMNNPLDEYTGMSAFGMAALSVSLFVTTTTLLLAFTQVLKLIMKSKSESPNPETLEDGGGRHFLGVHGIRRSHGTSGGFPPIPMDSNLVANLLGLHQSIHKWSDTVEAGLLRFYGSDKTSISDVLGGGLGVALGNIGDLISTAVESPGYYSVISRGIIRSGVEIVDKLKNIFKSPNVISGIKNLIGFFEVIKRSKFMAALNVFSSIGDTVLTQDNVDDNGDGRFSKMDNLDPGVNSVVKSRLKDATGRQTNKLSWSSNRAISLLSVPNVIRSPVLKGLLSSSPACLLGSPGDMSRTIYARNDGRLPAEAVEYFESVLESEYVPFYFHDIRTNELVSFHAFIASITDDYSAAWESVDAPGRVDLVKIYKNTVRKIGMSFYVISTSEADFDEMWIKINKLVTLVYPQYTPGRTVQDDPTNPQSRFIVPFSQLQAASPLIRIRLGDLIRSNYSKFALARLFGLGSAYVDDPSIADNVLKIDGKPFLSSRLKGDEEKKLNMIAKKVGFESELSDLVFLVSAADLDASNVVLSNATSSNISRNENTLSMMKMRNVNVLVKLNSSFINGNTTLCIVKPTLSKSDKYLSETEKYFMKQLISEEAAVNSIYIAPEKISTISSEVSQFISADGTGETNETFNKFMSAKENAVVKAFQDSGGKGLAGVIESMNFDWYDRVTWETTKIGKKAPKMCKVTISFSPIHDVSPGLDHNGYNRAPVYPVGPNDGESFKTSGKTAPLSRELLTNALGQSPAVSSDVDSGKKG